jgi:hypothetical protein
MASGRDLAGERGSTPRVTPIYQRPAVDAPVIRDRAPELAALTADTPVVIINRGNAPVEDRYDGEPWIIPPGHFTVPYGVAMHLRDRSVVPGSRDPISGKQKSFIGILNVDPEERCRPFTEAELRRFKLMPDAIDPAARSEPVELVNVADVRARMLSNQGVDIEEQAAQSDPGVLTKPAREDHEGLKLQRAGEAAKAAEGGGEDKPGGGRRGR